MTPSRLYPPHLAEPTRLYSPPLLEDEAGQWLLLLCYTFPGGRLGRRLAAQGAGRGPGDGRVRALSPPQANCPRCEPDGWMATLHLLTSKGHGAPHPHRLIPSRRKKYGAPGGWLDLPWYRRRGTAGYVQPISPPAVLTPIHVRWEMFLWTCMTIQN